ncbi:hypothetical protein BDV95DRAFT_613055 [Massariosphaeria phaeospora]|uniref:Uncharacterized protein n=1 Tax=Massariosphaeria phaeospora TaxID=100035 RepID=A0A7C8I295_9PLEO|nr:hypothetical protein BDV95DRAFT_613055 [Massariosphaeria phaeospora]
MTTTPEAEFSSILCAADGLWEYDPRGKVRIAFLENGTGYLSCSTEMSTFLGVNFHWSLVATTTAPPSLLTRLLSPLNIVYPPAQTGTLAITLVSQDNPTPAPTRPTNAFNTLPLQAPRLQEWYLTPAAFQRKTFNVSLQRGSFWPPEVEDAQAAQQAGWVRKYGWWMSWDKSPVPSAEEWTSVKGGPEANEWWEVRDFVGWMEGGM